MHRNKSVNVHSFAMIPRADIPRSSFRMQKAYKTTFGGRALDGGAESGVASGVFPIFVEEVLPGDTFNLRATMFARLATPLFPVMDNMYLDSFFFFCPNRLVWNNWQRFMGERTPNPVSSIAYTIPQIESPMGGYAIGSIYDYMGLPTVGQVEAAETITHSALPLRAYTAIWNQWFRDENLFNSGTEINGDGPDGSTSYAVFPRMKRHDYFTSCLPSPQKGTAILLPLGSAAPVRTSVAAQVTGAGEHMRFLGVDGTSIGTARNVGVRGAANDGQVALSTAASPTLGLGLYPENLYADLSAATSATINQLRQSFQIQRLLERDMRGGTRYTEIIRSHFGVISPDARLQRPEYLGGGSTPVNINPIAQTSATAASGTDTPQGNLSAMGTALMSGSGFTQSFTEHGYVIGMINVRADLTYQQGLRRHWSRLTRYDYYFPAFAMLGEQAVLSKEIYCDGLPADDDVFGYQERWAEYRYMPSEITSNFRSRPSVGSLDPWHLSQEFSTRPALNSTFIQDSPPIERITAVGAEALGTQFLLDVFFDIKAARPLPMYSVPGLIDHF